MKERFKQGVCVDVMFLKKEDNTTKVLLMKRCNTGYDDGYYELPGGHLEEKEDLFEAMIREIKEELLINIDKKDLEIVHLMHHYTGLRLNFIFKSIKEVDPKIGEPNKCSELTWADINNLPVETTTKVKRMIENVISNEFYDCM